MQSLLDNQYQNHMNYDGPEAQFKSQLRQILPKLWLLIRQYLVDFQLNLMFRRLPVIKGEFLLLF